MTVAMAKVERPVAIRQALSAGSNFAGVIPADGGGAKAPTFANDIYKYDALTAGGLFDPLSTNYAFEPHDALLLVGVELALANQTSWKIERVDVDGKIFPLFSGTTEASFVATVEKTRLIMTWGSTLKLTTVGATQAMTACLTFMPARHLYHG